jgi:RNA polymerase sigma-70 factor (ECF subfamily)
MSPLGNPPWRSTVTPLGASMVCRRREGGPGATVGNESIDEFYRHEYARLVAAIGLVVGNPDIARDAVDEALARAWERRGGDDIRSLTAWVRVVSLNIARSGFRRRAAEQRAKDRLFARAMHVGPEDRALAVDVARAVATLPARQREITVLHYFLDMSVLDIAALLGVSEGSVKTSLFRARATLANRLGAPADHEGTEEQVA